MFKREEFPKGSNDLEKELVAECKRVCKSRYDNFALIALIGGTALAFLMYRYGKNSK